MSGCRTRHGQRRKQIRNRSSGCYIGGVPKATIPNITSYLIAQYTQSYWNTSLITVTSEVVHWAPHQPYAVGGYIHINVTPAPLSGGKLPVQCVRKYAVAAP